MKPNHITWFARSVSLLRSAALMLGVLCGSGATLDAAPTAGTPYFMIVNKFSGKALDLIAGDTSNGARINQWSFDANGPNQRWAVLPTENNAHFKLISWVSGKCACIDGDSMNGGAQLHDWDYVGNNPGQQFDLVDAGNGWFKIRNVKSGKVLDDSGWGTGNDNAIIQWDDGGAQDNQLWRLQPWGDYFLRAASGRYVCVQGMGNGNGSRIIQYDKQDNPWFKWRFISEGDGWYGCFSLNALAKVLCVGAGSTQAGYYCHLWDYNPNNFGDQKVRVMPQLDGSFKFYFAHDGQSWDIHAGQTGNDVPLEQYPNNGNAWQKFAMERVPDGSDGGGNSGATYTGYASYNFYDGVPATSTYCNLSPAAYGMMVTAFRTDLAQAYESKYGSSPCGKQVKVTNTATGASVTLTIIDHSNDYSNNGGTRYLDLSAQAFDAIGNRDLGSIPVTFTILN